MQKGVLVPPEEYVDLYGASMLAASYRRPFRHVNSPAVPNHNTTKRETLSFQVFSESTLGSGAICPLFVQLADQRIMMWGWLIEQTSISIHSKLALSNMAACKPKHVNQNRPKHGTPGLGCGHGSRYARPPRSWLGRAA